MTAIDYSFMTETADRVRPCDLLKLGLDERDTLLVLEVDYDPTRAWQSPTPTPVRLRTVPDWAPLGWDGEWLELQPGECVYIQPSRPRS